MSYKQLPDFSLFTFYLSLLKGVMSERKGAIVRQSFGFAVRIVTLYKYLVAEKREFVLSKQLLRSGTAVGALVREVQNAERKADFIHKLGIAQKECDESIYWLVAERNRIFEPGRI